MGGFIFYIKIVMKKFELKYSKIALSFILIGLLGCSSDESPQNQEPEAEVESPEAVDDTYTTGENEVLRISNLLENDVIYDYGRITEFDASSVEGGSIQKNSDDSYSYTPPVNYVGEDSFEYTLCDAELPANCSSAKVTISITGAEPVAVDDSYEVKENSSLVLKNFTDNDELLDNAKVSSIDISGLEGTAVLNEDASITYTAPNGFTGEDTFTYSLCDDDVTPNCVTANIVITVSDEGNPTAVNDEFIAKAGSSTITLSRFLENDNLLDDATVTSLNYSGSGSVVLNEDQTISYTAPAGFSGMDEITYFLCDDDQPNATCSEGIIQVQVYTDQQLFSIPSELKSYYENIPFRSATQENFEILRFFTRYNHTTILEYTDRHDYLYDADEDPSNSANVILMYTGESRDRREWTSGSNPHTPQTFNTEHIFPQSRLDSEDAVTDLHHLRSTDDEINSLRLNYPYTDGSGQYELVNGNAWFPGDEWKGDVARMVLYLNVRYGEDYTKVGTLDLFLKWNREDPVSDFERQRNEVIEGAQGVRNPFIDNPYLATLIWGGTPAENTWE